MAIEKKYKGGKGMAVGEHKVQVTDIKVGSSKKGDPMLTITFENEEGQTIKGYYVKKLAGHMAALGDLKVAAGLKIDSPAEELQHKKLGISVDEQPENENGQIFMTIVGYGKEADVGSSPTPSHANDARNSNEIPF